MGVLREEVLAVLVEKFTGTTISTGDRLHIASTMFDRYRASTEEIVAGGPLELEAYVQVKFELDEEGDLFYMFNFLNVGEDSELRLAENELPGRQRQLIEAIRALGGNWVPSHAVVSLARYGTVVNYQEAYQVLQGLAAAGYLVSVPGRHRTYRLKEEK